MSKNILMICCMKIEIKDGINKTYYYRKQLKEFGCTFKRTGKYNGYWSIDTDDKYLAQNIKNFCVRERLMFYEVNNPYKRNSHYRADYFAKNKPLIKNGRKYYRCCYCGKYFLKKDITIDHLYPVSRVNNKYRTFNRNILEKFDITDINDTRNLVSACIRCNKKKSNKTGIWLLRGLLGRNIWFWKLYYSLISLICLLGIIIILSNFNI